MRFQSFFMLMTVHPFLVASPTLGAAHVTGNLNLQSGSTLSFGVEPSGAHAIVQVDGTASIAGSHLAVQAGSGNWPWQSSVQVIGATGGVSGQFADVKSNFAFLTPTLSYSANSVDLQLIRNDVQFGDLASSSNGRRPKRSKACEPVGCRTPRKSPRRFEPIKDRGWIRWISAFRHRSSSRRSCS